MSDVLIAVTFWLAGVIFAFGVMNTKEKNAQMVALTGVLSIIGALAFVFLVGVTVEVLQDTNVNAIIENVAGQVSTGDRRPKEAEAEVEAVPTPTPLPPDDVSAPAERPDWLRWLLYTPDELEG